MLRDYLRRKLRDTSLIHCPEPLDSKSRDNAYPQTYFRIRTSVQKTLGKMAKRKKYSWHWSSEKLSMSDARIKLYLSSLDFELQYWNLERVHRDVFSPRKVLQGP